VSISALTHTIGTLSPSNVQSSFDAIGSQVAYQGQLPQAQASLQNRGGVSTSDTGGDAATSTSPSNPLIKASAVASESVTITLSATAQKSIAQQNQALGQLRQLNEQLRNSNHNAAAARLKQLLQEFRALQQLGTASARALAALAKQISAAAADLSQGDESGATSTTDTSFADATPAGGQAPDDSANTQADEGSTPSAASPTAATSSNAPQPVAGTLVTPPKNIAAETVASEGHDAPSAGLQTADSRTAATSSGSANPGVTQARDAQRQALLDHLKEQASQSAAQTQAASADRDLLTQAANAVGAIQSIVKQAAEEEREKYKGKSGAELDQLAKTVDSSAAEVEKALNQVVVAPVAAPLSSAATSAAGIDITV
jgi:hypothetical protein